MTEPFSPGSHGSLPEGKALPRLSPSTWLELCQSGWQGPNHAQSLNAMGYSVLGFVARWRSDFALEIIDELMSKGALAHLNRPDPDGNTPLHWACAQQKADDFDARLIERLLTAGADPLSINARGELPWYQISWSSAPAVQDTLAFLAHRQALPTTPPVGAISVWEALARQPRRAPAEAFRGLWAFEVDPSVADVPELLRQHGYRPDLCTEAQRAHDRWRAQQSAQALEALWHEDHLAPPSRTHRPRL